MRTLLEPSKVLDRGGRPTVRELLASLVFNPVDGSIRLDSERIVMQRAAVNAELRRELIRLIGAQETRVFLIRLGFLSGQADARFVRTRWPNLDTGDAFTAGTRLHTFSGVVRVETVFNEFDLRKKRLSAEFLWHDGVEAAEYRRLPPAKEPVCWTQLGYASGYASEFFDTLIVYKEIECAAQGHKHCRVVGKPADVWGMGDPDVILFRERIVGQQGTAGAEPLSKARVRTAEIALSKLDHLILAPVRAQLDRLAPMALPVLLTGAPGTGRQRAARYLHRACGPAGGELRVMIGDKIDLDFCAAITKQGKGGRRGFGGETILIDAAENIPQEVQPHLARAIEEGLLIGGPRIVALASTDASGAPRLSCELRFALSALTVRMAALDARRGELAEIARAVLQVLAARMGVEAPPLDEGAAKALEQAAWPGNLRQLHAVLGAVLAARTGGGPISREEIETRLAEFPTHPPAPADAPEQGLTPMLSRLMEAGGFSLSAFEQSAYRAAVDRADGNFSAAARLLGLTRPQLAYRMKAD